MFGEGIFLLTICKLQKAFLVVLSRSDIASELMISNGFRKRPRIMLILSKKETEPHTQKSLRNKKFHWRLTGPFPTLLDVLGMSWMAPGMLGILMSK